MVRRLAAQFQFHHGAIKALGKDISDVVAAQFQFHHGAIKALTVEC